MTRTGIAARPPLEERAETLLESARAHSRVIATAIALAVAFAASVFFYLQWRQGKAERADQALARAEQSLAAGNVPLAQTDLQRVVTVYGGTTAADQAALLLAQVRYDQGKFPEGIAGLEGWLAGSHGAAFDAPAQALIAAGDEQLGRPGDAATHYQKAADAARFAADKAGFLADEARALADAGDLAAARALWARLAADPKGPSSGEARVRLGELEAKAVAK